MKLRRMFEGEVEYEDDGYEKTILDNPISILSQ